MKVNNDATKTVKINGETKLSQGVTTNGERKYLNNEETKGVFFFFPVIAAALRDAVFI